MLLKQMAAGAAVMLVAACAANPKQTLLSIDPNSSAYSSPACQDARQAALAYNDRVVSRAGLGIALGLLGPVGLLGAVAVDANQNNERKMLNDVIMRECTTLSGPEPLAETAGSHIGGLETPD